MKKPLFYALFLIFCWSCNSDETENDDEITLCDNSDHPEATYNILPLGASRVEGAAPEYFSFRHKLWENLIENDWSVDFIGTQCDNYNYDSSVEIDRNHEGRGGWTSGQINNRIDTWLNKLPQPDIVLLSSPGGNDALNGMSYDNAIENIKSIISKLQNNNPNITIFIEKMAPAKSFFMTNILSNFINKLHGDIETIALENSTATSQVIVVDMYTGFNDDMLADEVHYNNKGATFIAGRYLEAFEIHVER